uniref:Secreted protein n=1 Tax=Skeletonema marinoi TaxID=267567 RepID=A0A7S2PJJ7_9STRA
MFDLFHDLLQHWQGLRLLLLNLLLLNLSRRTSSGVTRCIGRRRRSSSWCITQSSESWRTELITPGLSICHSVESPPIDLAQEASKDYWIVKVRWNDVLLQ